MVNQKFAKQISREEGCVTSMLDMLFHFVAILHALQPKFWSI